LRPGGAEFHEAKQALEIGRRHEQDYELPGFHFVQPITANPFFGVRIE
jgi:hypothetical protein